VEDFSNRQCEITNAYLVSVYDRATSGDVSAQRTLAKHYLKEEDSQKALRWYAQAARQRDLEPIGKDANDVNQREERAIKLTFKEGANKYEAHAIAQSLGDTLAYDFKYYVKESHFTYGPSCRFIDPNCRENLTFETTFHTTSVDLNGDGADEVIVTLEAPNICGSGGCTAYILDSSSGVWKVIGKTVRK
jgi:hypothetical protein